MSIYENRTESFHAVAAQNHSGYEEPERAIEAKLAIAYEARTANLIAFRAMTGTILLSGTAPTLLMLQQLDAVDKQIVERLGLPNE